MTTRTEYIWLGVLIIATLLFVALDHCEAVPFDAAQVAPDLPEQDTVDLEGRDVDMTAINQVPEVDLDDLERRLRKWMPAEEVDEHMRRLRHAGD